MQYLRNEKTDVIYARTEALAKKPGMKPYIPEEKPESKAAPELVLDAPAFLGIPGMIAALEAEGYTVLAPGASLVGGSEDMTPFADSIDAMASEQAGAVALVAEAAKAVDRRAELDALSRAELLSLGTSKGLALKMTMAKATMIDEIMKVQG